MVQAMSSISIFLRASLGLLTVYENGRDLIRVVTFFPSTPSQVSDAYSRTIGWASNEES
jgi:hypothetical protein